MSITSAASTRWPWSIPISHEFVITHRRRKAMKEHRNSMVAVCTVGLLMLALISFAALTGRRAGAADQPSSNTEVKIDNFTFQAPSIIITAGTQVTWINRDDMPHAIASDDK